MKRCFALAGLLLFLLASPSYAGPPMDTVRANVEKVLDVLRNPAFKGEKAREIKKEKLRVIYGAMFDETELAKRSLARNWNAFDTSQRREFVNLFREVLEKAYIDKILAYTNEKVVYDRESTLSANQAEVQTRIVTASKEIPIDYRLILADGNWKVYDVVVENVSLVQNYRSQFNEILSRHTPDELIGILREKVKGS